MSETWRTEIQDILLLYSGRGFGLQIGTLKQEINSDNFWANITNSYWPKFIEFCAPIIDNSIGEICVKYYTLRASSSHFDEGKMMLMKIFPQILSKIDGTTD